jgi:outer membrane receptor for ferrienterochelin and colicins
MRLFVATLILTLLSVTPAWADNASEARLQYELGSELYRQKRFTEALERFIASNRLVPNPNVVFNIANIYVLLGKREAARDARRSTEWYVEAFNWTETLLAMATAKADKQDAAALRASILPRVAVVQVQSEPAGAEIFIDRESLGSVGRTPRDVATTAGDHPVIVKLSGHRPGTAQVTAKLGVVTSSRLVLERIVGVVQVTTLPAGARVQSFPGSLDVGTTPTSTRLPIGDARLTFTLPGYVSQTREIVVREGETTTVEVDLQRAADRAARLTVVGQPEGAIVRLGGRAVGKLPLTLSGLDPGRQSLEVAADSHDPWRGDLLLEAGGATRVDATLLRPQDRPWGGWKWLGYGAGTALLATGGVIGLQARSARDDFDAAPSSAGKDRVDRLNLTADVVLGTAVLTLATTAALHAVLGPRSRSRAQVRNQP